MNSFFITSVQITDLWNKRKTHVRRAVPSKSPIAVKYGMHTLSGSRLFSIRMIPSIEQYKEE